MYKFAIYTRHQSATLHYISLQFSIITPSPPWRPRIGQWTHVSVWAHGTMTMGLSCCRQWWCHQMTYWMSSSWRCCASRHLHISLHCEFNSKQTFMLYIRHSDMPQQYKPHFMWGPDWYFCVFVYLWHCIFVALCICSIVYLFTCVFVLVCTLHQICPTRHVRPRSKSVHQWKVIKCNLHPYHHGVINLKSPISSWYHQYHHDIINIMVISSISSISWWYYKFDDLKKSIFAPQHCNMAMVKTQNTAQSIRKRTYM